MSIKRKLLIGTLLMAGCHISLTGCSSEELLNEPPTQEEQNPNDNDGSQDESSDSDNSDDTEKPGIENPEPEIPEGYVRMTFTSSSNSRQSRVSVVEDPNNSGKLRWDAGDQVTIMTGSDMNNLKECKFTTEKGGVGYAFFEYIGKEVDTKTYFGIHNATYEMSGKQMRFIIPTGNGDEPLCQTEKNSSVHLNKYRPMYTDIQTSNENLNELTGLYFRHISSLLIFYIENKSGKDVKISSIKTKVSSGKPFYNKGVRLIANIGQSRSNVTYTSEESIESDFILLKLGKNGTGLQAGIGETFQAYQSILPVDFSSQPTDLEFYLNINGKEVKALGAKTSDIDNEFMSGTYYPITLIINEDETINVEIETGIEEWENGGNIIIPIDPIN